jgi:hypothetical protein
MDPAYPRPAAMPSASTPEAGPNASLGSRPWSPGDPIPGWEDGPDCTPPPATDTFKLQNPDLWSFDGSIGPLGKGVGTTSMVVVTRDCTSFACEPEGALDRSTPYAEILLRATVAAGAGALGPWGVGDWGPDQAKGRSVGLEAETVFGLVANPAPVRGHANVYASVCFDRVRPDEVRGVYTYVLHIYGDPVPIPKYDHINIWARFHARLDDHSGVEVASDLPNDPSGRSGYTWRYQGVRYEDAWPWDSITDATTRAAVMGRYRPR